MVVTYLYSFVVGCFVTGDCSVGSSVLFACSLWASAAVPSMVLVSWKICLLL